MCKYPSCKKQHAIEFSLIGLCKKHYLLIYNESLSYYDNKIIKRPHYDKIKAFIPEQQRLIREEDVYGTDCRSGSCDV